MDGFWLSCLSRLEKELTAQQFNTWIRPLSIDEGRSSKDTLALLAPNRFVLQWVRERFLGRMGSIAGEFFQHPVTISLELPLEASAQIGRAHV